MYKASLVISFYNKIDYLKLVLAGFERQTEKNFEIIISDDGSSFEALERLRELMQASPLNIRHIWQEDSGFRKNIMLNRSIMEADSNYLVFIDGDCIPHSKFVEEHVKNAQRGVCLTGRRVNLSEKITKLLTIDKIKTGFLEKNHVMLFFDQLLGDSRHIERGFYFKTSLMRNFMNKNASRGILGCNFSAYKEDLLSVNGFDERYQAPAIGEDTDIQFRLELKGIRLKSLVNIANQYHLYHKLLPRQEANERLYAQVLKEKQAFTPYGIEKQEDSPALSLQR